MKHADLTLVVPAYNERDNVRPFLGELRRALEGRQEAVEVLFVDDGGSDGTWGEVVAAARSWDDRVGVRGLSLSRNFGKEAAMLAGLEAARGDCLCIIDADLQQPPAVALKMYDLLMASPDYDCVAAFQRERVFPVSVEFEFQLSAPSDRLFAYYDTTLQVFRTPIKAVRDCA